MTTRNFSLTCLLSLFCINLSYAKWLQVDPKAEKYYSKSPYAYDPASVAGLPSNALIRTSADITAGWVQRIVYKGENIYTPAGSARTGLYPVNINSTTADVMKAYPGVNFPGVSNTQPFKNFYPMYYKK